MGSPILMGRKTYESIGRPLPGRTNIILSRNQQYLQAGCLVFNDLETALQEGCESANEIFIIGGSDLYEVTLPIADTIYLTIINKEFEGDAYFPEIDLNEWSEVEQVVIHDDPDVAFSYSFLKFERKTKAPASKNSQEDNENS